MMLSLNQLKEGNVEFTKHEKMKKSGCLNSNGVLLLFICTVRVIYIRMTILFIIDYFCEENLASFMSKLFFFFVNSFFFKVYFIIYLLSCRFRFKIHFSDNNHFWTNMFTNEKQNLKLVNGSIDSEDSINIMFPIRIYGRSTGEFNPQSSLFVTGFDKDAVEAVLEEAKSISQIELFTENLDYPQIFNVDFEVMKHISMSELSNIPESRDAYCSFLEGKGLAITGKMETVRAIKHQLLNLIFLRVKTKLLLFFPL